MPDHLTRQLTPDLEISDGTVDYWGGSQAGLRTVIRNIGTTNAPTSTLVFYRNAVTGTVATTDTVPALAVGQAITLTTPWDFGALDSGSYPIVAVVNQHDFTETFTANNLYTITLQALPDVAISPYYLWTTSPTATQVVVTATLFNFGPITATDVAVGFYRDNQLANGVTYFTRTISVLSPASTVVLTGQMNAPLDCSLFVFADPDDTLPETTRSNNLASISYQGSCPAIALNTVMMNGATSGSVNQPYTFTANINPVTATQPITFVWQAQAQPPVTVVGGLSSTVVFTWTQSGTHNITVTATNDGSVVTDTRAITIAAGPLASLAVTPNPVTVTVGMTRSFTGYRRGRFRQFSDH